MGLDLTAYSNIKLLSEAEAALRKELDEDEYWDTVVSGGSYAGFEKSTRGLADHDVEVQRWNSTWIAMRDYDISESESYSWHGGGYIGYGMRRDIIRSYAGITPWPNTNPELDDWYAENEDKPFFELVFFADNEGSIGHEAAEDLFNDFTYHRVELVDAGLPQEWVSSWIKGLQLAADNGLVHFH